MPARGVEQPRKLSPIARSQGLVLAEDNQQLTDQQFTRITRTLAEPRRVRILREIAAHGNSIPLACLLRWSKNARIVRFHKIGPPDVLQLDALCASGTP